MNKQNGKSVVISWKTIEQVHKYEKESKNLIRNLSHLDNEHVIKKRCPQMRVCKAAQIFSNKTAHYFQELSKQASE